MDGAQKMPSIRNIQMGPCWFHAPYYDELVSNPTDPLHVGRLPPDLEAHACWHYYIMAAQALDGAKKNMVYDDQLSKRFDVNRARKLLESISFLYGSTPAKVTRYWDAVIAQRRALGFSDNAALPAAFMFRFN